MQALTSLRKPKQPIFLMCLDFYVIYNINQDTLKKKLFRVAEACLGPSQLSKASVRIPGSPLEAEGPPLGPKGPSVRLRGPLCGRGSPHLVERPPVWKMGPLWGQMAPQWGRGAP